MKQEPQRMEDVVDIAIANLLFSNLSLEKIEKIPKWLLENIEKNKLKFKQTLHSYTTPRIEKILSKVPRSFTITTHEEHPYSSEYVDIEDMRQALTEAHQAGDKEGYERGKKEGIDEAVAIAKSKRITEDNLEEARYTNGTKVKRKEIKELIRWVNNKTVDDTIKALTDNK